MDTKRAFLLLILAAVTSALAAALQGRSECLDHNATSNAPASMSAVPCTAITARRTIKDGANHPLKKRDYYACYQTSPSPVIPDDCQKIVERVKGHAGGFNLLPGLCLVWLEGTCKARFCAADSVTRVGLNQTFQWVGQQLDHLFQDCVVGGQDGLKGDCLDLNGGCGFYRLHLEHRGQDVLNITGSGN
ncbi:uncharacterized protein PG998_007008 [Apiospora kogelbergensis]|uniref:Uncharacterized protein n=1 Tax=Apiospora kogelbergensis TaxID=1337665 RepID=A0AAW0QTQ3_9PEZI